jgi:predicted nuclease of predicted toxin-antitoxin system
MPWIRPKEESNEDIDRYFKECKGKARFIIDECLGVEVTKALRKNDWNVKDVNEVRLKGHSDEDIFAYAKRECRILLTYDEDFLDDKRYPLPGNPGVIVLPGADGNVSALSHALGYIYHRYPGFYKETKVSISKDGTIIIKHLTKEGIATSRFRTHEHGNDLQMWINETV